VPAALVRPRILASTAHARPPADSLLPTPHETLPLQGPRCPLATRILFHCAHSRQDEDALMALHSSLSNSLEDQLSLAALHFNRGNYQVLVGRQWTAPVREKAQGVQQHRGVAVVSFVLACQLGCLLHLHECAPARQDKPPQQCSLPVMPGAGLLCCHDGVQEATDTYKALLLDHRDLLTLNVYVALCYAKLDYYDVSTEILQVCWRGRVGARRLGCWGGAGGGVDALCFRKARLDGALLLNLAASNLAGSTSADMVPYTTRVRSVLCPAVLHASFWPFLLRDAGVPQLLPHEPPRHQPEGLQHLQVSDSPAAGWCSR
jgi:hypothetical protein